MKKKIAIPIINITLAIIFILFKYNTSIAQEEDVENLNVLERWVEWSDGENMLFHHLNDQAFDLLDARDKEIAGLKTQADWERRQKKVKNLLLNLVGPFPEKTPLNAKVTGIVQKDGFRIEKIMYESIPELYVTAALLIPDGNSKNQPVIIQVSGHSFPAFRTRGTQQQLYNLVKRGFIVFAIDPFGQGERIQYWDNIRKKSEMGDWPTGEHTYFGNQMFLNGISPIRYFVWDAIRGVDYLLTRTEVDPERIGIYGCSGGGTQTTFIAAMDNRIEAAVPGCYITGYRRLLESIGPQDAEQNIYHGILNGLTHADLLEVRAPKPLLISSTTRDFFSIQGAFETFEEVKKAYKAYDKEENARQVIDDAGHGFNDNITDVYVFFQEVFNLPGISEELPFEGFDPGDLKVTESGQLSTSTGGKLAFDINKDESEKLLKVLEHSRENIAEHINQVPQNAARISGFKAPDNKVNSVFRGRYQRDGYSVEMYALQGEGDYVIPLLLFIPKDGDKFSSVIYLHPDGKIADAASAGRIEQLIRKGFIVAAPDLIGTGEVGDISRENFEALMIGRSVVGIQAGDVIRVVDFLKDRADVVPDKIGAVAFKEMGPTLLHAAAFDKSIWKIALVESLVSYRTVVMNKYYNDDYSPYFVAGALTSYDLPDLAASLAPEKLLLINSIDGLGNNISGEEEMNDIQVIRRGYLAKSAEENFQLVTTKTDDDIFENLLNWIE